MLKLCCEVAKCRPLLLKLYQQSSVIEYLNKHWPTINQTEALFLIYEFSYGRSGVIKEELDTIKKSENCFGTLLSNEVRIFSSYFIIKMVTFQFFKIGFLMYHISLDLKKYF